MGYGLEGGMSVMENNNLNIQEQSYKCSFSNCPGHKLLELENKKNEICNGEKTINEVRKDLGLDAIEGGDTKYASKEEIKELKNKRRLENNKKFFDSVAGLGGDKLYSEKEYEVASKIISSLENIKAIRATSILNLCIKAIQHSFISFQENK